MAAFSKTCRPAACTPSPAPEYLHLDTAPSLHPFPSSRPQKSMPLSLSLSLSLSSEGLVTCCLSPLSLARGARNLLSLASLSRLSRSRYLTLKEQEVLPRVIFGLTGVYPFYTFVERAEFCFLVFQRLLICTALCVIDMRSSLLFI